MTDLLLAVATYLAVKTSKVLGKQVFYHEMPDAPDECICIQETKTSLTTVAPPQVDAVSRRLQIVTRAKTNDASNALGELCYRWLYSSDDPIECATGFVELSKDTYVFCDLRNKPTWQKADQKGRKYFAFEAVVTTTRF